ncbi:MAG: helix-turn-helix transcriptional regulator [Clostridium sp.]
MLGKRIKSMREDNDLRQQDVANKLGVQLRTYQKYEEGSIEPKIAAINTLADMFKCTVDYLIGRTDHPHEGIHEFSYNDKQYKIGYDKKVYPEGIPSAQAEEIINQIKKLIN